MNKIAMHISEIQTNLSENEGAFGFKYPPSFISEIGKLAILFESPGFRRSFVNTRLLVLESDIKSIQKELPPALIPFMLTENSSMFDVYAFDSDDDQQEFEVVVWADHAVVQSWGNFTAFIEWAQEQST